jgi:hypothetical protein
MPAPHLGHELILFSILIFYAALYILTHALCLLFSKYCVLDGAVLSQDCGEQGEVGAAPELKDGKCKCRGSPRKEGRLSSLQYVVAET